MRSCLIVPGDDRARLDAALDCAVGTLIIVLGGADTSPEPTLARSVAADFLRSVTGGVARPMLYVRVHALATGFTDDDLHAVMPAGPDGIVLPNTVGARDVQHLGAKLAVHEAENALPHGRTRILAIATDTASGLLAAGSLPGSSLRLAGIACDADALRADLGAEPRSACSPVGGCGDDPDACRHARATVLIVAAAAGVAAIDATLETDLDRLAAECRRARRDGFAGRMTADPAAVPIIHEAFGPNPARRLA